MFEEYNTPFFFIFSSSYCKQNYECYSHGEVDWIQLDR